MSNNQNRTISQKAARIISTLFVPPSFAIILFPILAFTLEQTAVNKLILISVTITFGFLFHIMLFLFMIRRGRLVDMDATIKEERTVPFIIAVLIYSAGLAVLIYYGINIISIAFWFCYISNTILILIINKYWKISAHAMGASGPLALMLFAWGPAALAFIVLLGLIGWSRIKLNCHTPAQVAAGSAAGFLFTYLQLFLITKYF